MKATVTEKGILIPRRLLGNAKVVEIHREKSGIVVRPLDESDPIRNLGKKPVRLGIEDASESTDRYLYSGKP